MWNYETDSLEIEDEIKVREFVEENINDDVETKEIGCEEDWIKEEVVLTIYDLTEEQADMLREFELGL